MGGHQSTQNPHMGTLNKISWKKRSLSPACATVDVFPSGSATRQSIRNFVERRGDIPKDFGGVCTGGLASLLAWLPSLVGPGLPDCAKA